MIARIDGILEALENNTALVRLEGGLTYELLLPAFTAARLGNQIGQAIRLHTLHYIESQGQGTTLVPRLAGFLSPEDRDFFELFTTCKGIGNRKALRAMALDSGRIAAAIADRDVALLQTLPEVGRRTAETIVATLHGKVDSFLSAAAYGAGEQAEPSSTAGMVRSLCREALQILLDLGENRVQAAGWIDQVMRGNDPPQEVQTLIARVYEVKTRG